MCCRYGSAFVRDGAVLLLHGYSGVVMRLLEKVTLTAKLQTPNNKTLHPECNRSRSLLQQRARVIVHMYHSKCFCRLKIPTSGLESFAPKPFLATKRNQS